jgi:DNA ligase (NAD+)
MTLSPSYFNIACGFSWGHSNDLMNQLKEKFDSMTLEKFLNAVNIDMVGKRYSKKIAEKLGAITFIESLAFENVVANLFGFNSTTHQRIYSSFVSRFRLIRKFMDNGLKFKTNGKKESNMCAYNFVVTGTLSKPRKEIQQIIESAGHVFQDSITKDTNYLVAGADIGKNEIEKAKKYNVTVIDETAMNELLEP